VTRDEERYRRPGIRKEVREEVVTEHRHRRPQNSYQETRIDVEETPRRFESPIDQIERAYRKRPTSPPAHSRSPSEVGSSAGRSNFNSNTSLTLHRPHHHHHHEHHRHEPRRETTVVDETIVDYPARRRSYSQGPSRVGEDEDITTVDVPSQQLAVYRPQPSNIPDEIVEPASYPRKSTMPHYDDVEVQGGEVIETRMFSESETVTIPTHHIRIGDILILQGRPCQVIRISTSSATGQHRYLGVDLFTKQLHEESSSVTNPAPSVVVQTMRGPIFKQYRVLDIAEGAVVAMTETGDVKQGLPVIDQSNLWSRLKKAFESGRGSVRILVVSDHGREMAVDMKVVHGSRL
jgi:translation elongation factor P/translation initiation factor 5A